MCKWGISLRNIKHEHKTNVWYCFKLGDADKTIYKCETISFSTKISEFITRKLIYDTFIKKELHVVFNLRIQKVNNIFSHLVMHK